MTDPSETNPTPETPETPEAPETPDSQQAPTAELTDLSTIAAIPSMEPRTSSAFKKWNRKVHIYLGLYTMLFLWLFSLSGLFMNHPQWFGGQPNREKQEKQVVMPTEGNRLEKAWDIMEQLELRGEVYFLRPAPAGSFGFLSMRPNVRDFVTVKMDTGATTISHVTNVNHPNIGAMNQLHVFTGNLGERERDWLPTIIWCFSMDALCVGIIILVISSLYMSWKLNKHRVGVAISFVLGVGVFVFFMWGLSWTTGSVELGPDAVEIESVVRAAPLGGGG